MKRMLAKKTAKQANLHPVGNEEKKKNPSGGCSAACTGSHSTVLLFHIV